MEEQKLSVAELRKRFEKGGAPQQNTDTANRNRSQTNEAGLASKQSDELKNENRMRSQTNQSTTVTNSTNDSNSTSESGKDGSFQSLTS